MRPIDADKLKEKSAPMDDSCDYAVWVWDIDEAPTLTYAEIVPHGRWVEGKTLEKCSICGKKGFPDWHYCPSCGAKMDGGKDK